MCIYIYIYIPQEPNDSVNVNRHAINEACCVLCVKAE